MRELAHLDTCDLCWRPFSGQRAPRTHKEQRKQQQTNELRVSTSFAFLEICFRFTYVYVCVSHCRKLDLTWTTRRLCRNPAPF